MDGTKVWTDRDVKLCKSEYINLLGSRHPCEASEDLCVGLEWYDRNMWVPIDRDRNAALAIANLIGVAVEDRPDVYSRRRPNDWAPP